MNLMRLLKQNRRSDRLGATLVEFAIIAPVFFLVIFAMFEFSRFNIIRHTSDNAAYEAARIAIVPGATAGEAIAEANRILNIVGARNATVSVNPSVITKETSSITVSIDIPMNSNGLVVPKFTSNKTLHAESTLRTERVQTR